MVAENGLKWALAVLALSTACCAVAVGLPMWIDITYTDVTPNFYFQQGLWQVCVQPTGDSLSCSVYTGSGNEEELIPRYLGTAAAGALLFSTILLVFYTCKCAETTCLAATALLLIMISCKFFQTLPNKAYAKFFFFFQWALVEQQ